MSDQTPLVALHTSALERLFPLHVILRADGRILHIGPTLERLLGHLRPSADFFKTFTVERPRNVTTKEGLDRHLGEKLNIAFNPAFGDKLQFRCVATTLANSADLFIDFVLAENLTDVMKRFQLTSSDFRPNDLSLDLIYALEAQKALLEDSKSLARALSDAKEQAEAQANLDPVTGIANRRALHDRLHDLFHQPENTAHFALLQIDLDKFKAINDALGHAAGDEVLIRTAQKLGEFAGKSGLAARLGGDEFAILIPDPPNNTLLGKMSEDIISELSQPRLVGGQLAQVGACIGISTFHPTEMMSPDQPLLESDIALYRAKEYGAAAVFLTPRMLATHLSTTETIIQLERAVKNNEFVPYFQPQVDIVTGSVAGVEVLARWNHPKRGILPPGAWIEAADRAGLMPAIDAIVLDHAIRIIRDWRADGVPIGKPSFNLTAANLRSPEFVEHLQDILLQAAISPSEVQIELLESILFDSNDDNLIDACMRLHEAGFKLALDDFGTGHASIATLVNTPVSVLKIDRAFVSGLDRHPKLQRITRAILAMSAKMGLDVIAEGVETNAELALLRSFQCRVVQGYLFSEPLNGTECTKWIIEREARADNSGLERA